jgi:hypothetical protein
MIVVLIQTLLKLKTWWRNFSLMYTRLAAAESATVLSGLQRLTK